MFIVSKRKLKMSTNVSVKNAAEKLSISSQRVRTLCREGALKSEKIGNTWVLDINSVDKYSQIRSSLEIGNHSHINAKKKPEGPVALSFFSGAMGLDLGLEKAGFDIRLACEVDKYCRQTIAFNRPSTALLGDVNEYSADDILESAGLSRNVEIDLIAGGPPCQAFSTAGNRKGFNDDRGNVFLKYLDLAIELNPKYIVLENVRGLLSCPMDHRPHDQRGDGHPDLSEDELKGGALNFVLNRLKKSGYGYSFNLYNSANFGSPQTRERVILICSRDGKIPPFLTPTHAQHGDFGLPQWNDVRSCISDLSEHDHLKFPEKRLKYYRKLKAGQNWKNLPIEDQKEAMGKSFYSGGGKTGFFRRLAWDKPSPTLVTHPAMPATDLAHPEEDRPLSVQEYKRIQEFPDQWDISGPLIQKYKQIGNAVPYSLGYAVGKLVKNLLEGNKVESFSDFSYSRYKNTSNIEWEEEFNKRRMESKVEDKQLLML